MNVNYDEVFKTRLMTNVMSCVQDKDEFLVALEETLFFVESGGQASDVGWIDGKEVVDVYTYKGTVYHVLKEAVCGTVEVVIDEKIRMMHMQTHSCQHLVSVGFVELFGIQTIGNHAFADGTCDIELDCDVVSRVMLEQVEEICNDYVSRDFVYEISYISEEEAMQYAGDDVETYRGLSEYRLISIKDRDGVYYDHNLCGCLHVPSSRYLKAIHLLRSEKTTHGVRVVMRVGDFLIQQSHKEYDLLDAIGTNVGTPFDEIETGIEQLRSKVRSLTKTSDFYRSQYLELLVEKNLNELEGNVIVVYDPSLTIEDMKYLLVQYTNRSGLIGVGMHVENERLSLVISKSKDVEDFDCGACFKELSKAYGLRGGGSKLVAQGGGKVFDSYRDLILACVKDNLGN